MPKIIRDKWRYSAYLNGPLVLLLYARLVDMPGLRRSREDPQLIANTLLHLQQGLHTWRYSNTPTRRLAFTTSAVPYLDLANKSSHISLAEFADIISDQALKPPEPGTERQDWRNYLEFVKLVNTCAGVPENQEADASADALVLTVTSNRELRWLVFNDFAHLFLNRQELEIALKISLGHERKQETGQKIDQGFGNGMG